MDTQQKADKVREVRMNGALITALNEADTIGQLVKFLKMQGLEVCVIDDGSTDNTGVIAGAWGADVIRHDTPQGIGKSLLEGWRYALWRGWDRLIQIDAGGSHDPSQIDILLTSGADITIGSRFLPTSQYIGRGWRSIASRITAALLNFATHKKITDWTSGYRIFSNRALQELEHVQYMTNAHTWQIEVLGEAIHKKLTISEFPITYTAGNSTMKWKTVDDLIKVYLWVLNR